jgi:hypothetical protein
VKINKGAKVDTPRWKKSSFTGANGDCVEAATPNTRTVYVRDSKAPELGVLTVPPASWAAFLDTVK